MFPKDCEGEKGGSGGRRMEGGREGSTLYSRLVVAALSCDIPTHSTCKSRVVCTAC